MSVYRGPDRDKIVRVTKKGAKKGTGFEIHKGALHRALGIPESEPIGTTRLHAALHNKSPRIRRMARSAVGLEHMGH